MTDTKMQFKRTLLVASLSTLFAMGLSGCSEDKSEPLSSNSGAGVSAPAPSQPSAADVKQPEPIAEKAEKMAEMVEEKAVKAVETVETKVDAVVETAEKKVEEVVAAVAPPATKSGDALYATCIGCHGAAGEGGVGPKLSGQPEADIASKLVQYKAGEQVGPMTAMMAPMAQGLSDEEIQVVSSYIAGL